MQPPAAQPPIPPDNLQVRSPTPPDSLQVGDKIGDGTVLKLTERLALLELEDGSTTYRSRAKVFASLQPAESGYNVPKTPENEPEFVNLSEKASNSREFGNLAHSTEFPPIANGNGVPSPANGVSKAPEDALRFNDGKPELWYLLTFGAALRQVAAVCTYGAKKYSVANYTKGAPLSEHVSAAFRHLLAWQEGEDDDPESGLPHLAHAAWNVLRLCQEAIVQPHRDDRCSYQRTAILLKRRVSGNGQETRK